MGTKEKRNSGISNITDETLLGDEEYCTSVFSGLVGNWYESFQCNAVWNIAKSIDMNDRCSVSSQLWVPSDGVAETNDCGNDFLSHLPQELFILIFWRLSHSVKEMMEAPGICRSI